MKNELNVKEVTTFLNMDYEKLKKQGEIDRLMQGGVTKAMPIKIDLPTKNGESVRIESTARLTLGLDREGNKTVQPILKRNAPRYDAYRDIKLSEDQQAALKAGKTIVVKDQISREHVVKYDDKLNQVAGIKKSNLLVPERIPVDQGRYQKLKPSEQNDLKRGQTVALETPGGKKLQAVYDPVERQLKVKEVSLKESLTQKNDVNQTMNHKMGGPKL